MSVRALQVDGRRIGALELRTSAFGLAHWRWEWVLLLCRRTAGRRRNARGGQRTYRRVASTDHTFLIGAQGCRS
jgi:hypothetical protein